MPGNSDLVKNFNQMIIAIISNPKITYFIIITSLYFSPKYTFFTLSYARINSKASNNASSACGKSPTLSIKAWIIPL